MGSEDVRTLYELSYEPQPPVESRHESAAARRGRPPGGDAAPCAAPTAQPPSQGPGPLPRGARGRGERIVYRLYVPLIRRDNNTVCFTQNRLQLELYSACFVALGSCADKSTR